MNHVLSFVMAGGRGSRLKVLTKDRSKSALDIFSHYKILDFVATNIVNTGIHTMLVAAQFEADSLNEYIRGGEIWGFDGSDRILEVINPYESGKPMTFEGTADSVRKSVDRIDKYNPSIVLILGGDHIYTMDYKNAIYQHTINDADITIMTNAVPDNKVSDFGIVKIDEVGRIIDFAEKPTDEEVIDDFRLTARMKDYLGIDSPSLNFLASMGNYIFFWDRLKRFLKLPGVDFGKDIIPAIKKNGGALYAYVFNGYWRDVGKVQDYFSCSMEFTNGKSPINFLKHQVKTSEIYVPPYIATSASLQNVILDTADVIRQGSIIIDSVLGRQVVVEERCIIDHCVLLGADTNGPHDTRTEKRQYTTHIGRGSSLSYAILDRNVWVGEGVDIGPHNGTPEKRGGILQSIGLKPYRELDHGMVEGDFYIEPDTGILVIRKQYDADPKKPILPDGLKC